MPIQPVWEKEISDVFTLIEYPETSKEPRCLIIGGNRAGDDKTKTLSLFFQTWGLDRETITNLQCSIVFQAVLEVGIVDEISGFTFKEALAWAGD
ncbi:hypothetical protein [Chamaesiphon sp. VAR_48_metabat_403]|uniref:hypothetical protein n=1 Tax=Chamaesiphon sp. VAR_48_metabat_403 TaxID=2964700 RepID=UPI00286E4D5C|nr:hypothetical protein [Chamaesiphon sp. VAR_48_metabat_403]